MRKTKVFFTVYNCKTSENRIICRDASIREDGTAIIQLSPVGKGKLLERRAGDWIEAESFNVFWRRPLEEKAKAIAEDLLRKGRTNEEI